jgi:hypothetical protein
MRRMLSAWFIVAASALATGCAEVPVWERGNLAKPHMAADPMPQQRTLQEHVYSSREAGSAGATGQGDGCGCY